jgi:subtilisin family serine protease
MPTPSYYALRPPADISRLTNADLAHNRGFRGAGIKVAMVDSGLIQDHDYYAGRAATAPIPTLKSTPS